MSGSGGLRSPDKFDSFILRLAAKSGISPKLNSLDETHRNGHPGLCRLIGPEFTWTVLAEHAEYQLASN
jgi:hypothetical protein